MARRRKRHKAFQRQVRGILTTIGSTADLVGWCKGPKTGAFTVILGEYDEKTKEWQIVLVLVPSKKKKIQLLQLQRTDNTYYGQKIRSIFKEEKLGKFIAR